MTPAWSFGLAKFATMMAVVVTVCAAFGFTVRKAKTKVMCLRPKGTVEVVFDVSAADRYAHNIQIHNLS